MNLQISLIILGIAASCCFAKVSQGRNAIINKHPKLTDPLGMFSKSLNSTTTSKELVPCTCGIFLNGQFKKGSPPKGNPALQSEIDIVYPCNAPGFKLCQNRCLDTVSKVCLLYLLSKSWMFSIPLDCKAPAKLSVDNLWKYWSWCLSRTRILVHQKLFTQMAELKFIGWSWVLL